MTARLMRKTRLLRATSAVLVAMFTFAMSNAIYVVPVVLAEGAAQGAASATDTAGPAPSPAPVDPPKEAAPAEPAPAPAEPAPADAATPGKSAPQGVDPDKPKETSGDQTPAPAPAAKPKMKAADCGGPTDGTTGPASGDGITPTYVTGTLSCGEHPVHSIDPWRTGTYTESVTSSGTFTVLSGTSKRFGWTTDGVKVYGVAVVAAEGAFVYRYPSGATSDSNLLSPDGQDGQQADICRIMFCYEPEAPTGIVWVAKYNDLNHSGLHDLNEPWMPGWAFDLSGGPNGSITRSGVTDENGILRFPGLPDGTYRVAERQQPGWVASTAQPLYFTLTNGELGRCPSSFVGNYRADVTKTFSLSLSNAPAAASFSVDYSIGGGALQRIDLTGSDPYTGKVSVPYGGSISDMSWYAEYAGERLLLGTSDDETLIADKTNPLTYDSSIEGMKFDDKNGNGVKDPGDDGLAGWTIQLYRTSGDQPALYAETLTGPDGTYAFHDVLPGTYFLREVSPEPGWHNTVAPEGTFRVANGTHLKDMDFGNMKVMAGVSITKTGQAIAHRGDTVTYTIVVTNNGNTQLSNVAVVDPTVGLSTTIPTLAAGASMTFTPSKTISATDPDPLPNTATVTGTTVLGTTVTDSDSWSVDIIAPAIKVTKTVDHTKVIKGSTVEYTYQVVNSGDTTLSGVTLGDDKLGPLADIGELPPGPAGLVTTSAVLTTSTVNVASTSGHDVLGLEVSATDTASVDVYDPSISIVKSADPTVTIGGPVLYTYLVKNTGDIPLAPVVVTDDHIGLIGTIPSLLPGESAPLTWTKVIDADTPNVGTATGYYGTVDTDFYGHVDASSEAFVHVVHPGVKIVKTASPTTILAGSDVAYTYEVTNSGDTTLPSVAVTDDKLGDIGTVGPLAPKASSTLTTMTALATSTVNVATASGHDEYGYPVSDTDTATVKAYTPSIKVEKTADQDNVLPGTVITYTYKVTNTGDAPLTAVDVTDDVLAKTVGTMGMLAPGASVTFTATGTVSVDTRNVATATGTYGQAETSFYGTIHDTDDATVHVVHPGITLEKSASPTRIIAGSDVTYTYVVTNSGDTTITSANVTDDHLGTIGSVGPLAPQASSTLSTTTAVPTSTVNVGTVRGTDEYGHPVSDTDTAAVEAFTPSISVVKTVTPNVGKSPLRVEYTYLVKNTGDIALTPVTVMDDRLDLIGTIESLAPGAQQLLSAAATITADTTNTVTATGYYGDPESSLHGYVTATDSAFVDIVASSVKLTKTPNATLVNPGSRVTYTYTVENTGDTILSNLAVTDDKLGAVGTVDSLAPGASSSLTTSTVLSVTTTNTAVVRGYDPFEDTVTDRAEATVAVTKPAITIVKRATPGTVLAGGQVVYTYTVTNSGNAALEGVVVTDDKLGTIGTIGAMAAGQQTTLSKTTNISVDTTNRGTVIGYYPLFGTDGARGSVSAFSDAFVDVIHPSITVSKTVDQPLVLPGTTVTYTYTVTNNGDTALVNVALVDDKLGQIGTIGSLAISGSQSFTKTAPIGATVTNVVTASATDAAGHPVSATASATVTVVNPAIRVIKTPSATLVHANDSVVYTYAVTNTGNVPLDNVIVTDDKIGTIGNAGTLQAGASTVLTASATLTQRTVNVATAVGTYHMLGRDVSKTVTDTAWVDVDVINPAIQIVKTSDAPADGVQPGTTVLYTYAVKNTGDTTLTGVAVSDDKLGDVGSVGTLTPGASATLTASAVLNSSVTNVASASGVDILGRTVTDTDQLTVRVFLPSDRPDLTIQKVADPTTAQAGDTVTYTLRYRNLGGGTATDFTIVDDFDERYVTVTDAAGGVVSGGKITWSLPGPLVTADGWQTITYKVKIADEMPSETTNVDNVVVISVPDDSNPDNDTATARVVVPPFLPYTPSKEETGTSKPFLPFTGGDTALLLLIAALSALGGVALRRRAARSL